MLCCAKCVCTLRCFERAYYPGGDFVACMFIIYFIVLLFPFPRGSPIPVGLSLRPQTTTHPLAAGLLCHRHLHDAGRERRHYLLVPVPLPSLHPSTLTAIIETTGGVERGTHRDQVAAGGEGEREGGRGRRRRRRERMRETTGRYNRIPFHSIPPSPNSLPPSLVPKRDQSRRLGRHLIDPAP